MDDRSGAEKGHPSGFALSGAGEGRVMNFLLHPEIILVNYLENVFVYGILLGR